MESWDGNRLSTRQAGLVETWLPGVRLVGDLSWDLIDTAVLEVVSGRRRYIVKAGGPANHHIQREISAHESWVQVLSRQDRAPTLMYADRPANVLVSEYLEGGLVEGADAEYTAETYVQAGALLRAFHQQAVRSDLDYESAATVRALAWLGEPHRINASAAEEARAILGTYEPKPADVVPTHGDWQPRNWLVDGREVKVIDFGRFEFRPAASDFCRLAVQQWRKDPQLELAFFSGYGPDPRNSQLWKIMQLREAVSTAAWAYMVGDFEFERQGHQMLHDALSRF